MYKKIDLNNGLRFITNQMSHMESAAIGIWISTGSRYEDKTTSGISHFLEHMVFKGTPTRSNRRIKEEIEGRGGTLNGFTSEEATCYLAKVSRRHIDIALGVLSDMVLNASLSRDDIERERAVIVEEIKMYRDLPNHHVYDLLSEMMWPDHALGFPIAGNAASVKSITRRDLLNYKEASYTPRNIVVALCGNLDHDSMIERIKKLFQENVKTKPSEILKFKKTQMQPQVKILHKQTEQTRLCMGLHTFGRMHKDRFALTLLHVLLGANMSSRLFESVREKKGLAYEIGTDVKRYKETGAFMVNAGIDHKKATEAVRLIIDELAKIKEKAVPQAELKRAKEYFNVQLSLALEDTLDHMLWLGEHLIMSEEIPSKADIIKKIDSVSSRDIQKVARDIFTAININLALIGPLRDEEKQEIEKELSNL